MLEFLFNKVTDVKGCSFIKQRLQQRCFHVNIAKFLRTAFFIKHLRWLLLNKVKTNLKSTWFILLSNWLYHVIKSIKTFNSKHSAKLQRCRNRNTNKLKREQLKHRKKKPSFTKRVVENADFYKPVLSKIMTTRE